MVTFPNAKINIGLNIISKRADGYHNIETIMYPVCCCCDILEIVPAKSDKTTLSISGRNVDCPVEKNLVMKAYRAMESKYGIPSVDIFLHKVIPDGAGLGGGSADAAFTIKTLNQLFDLNLSNAEMTSIAATIGADCPFFIYNKPMLATGIGTEFSSIELDLSGYNIVLVKPSVSVPTSQAYSGVKPIKPEIALVHQINKPIEEWQQTIKNDFEKSIFPIYPVISDIKQKLLDMGAEYASMSGSGSSVYGIFKSDNLSAGSDCKFEQCDTIIGTL